MCGVYPPRTQDTFILQGTLIEHVEYQSNLPEANQTAGVRVGVSVIVAVIIFFIAAYGVYTYSNVFKASTQAVAPTAHAPISDAEKAHILSVTGTSDVDSATEQKALHQLSQEQSASSISTEEKLRVLQSSR